MQKIILIKQYRKSIEDTVLELPGGKLELNENPRECAIREFRQKTGYDAENFSGRTSNWFRLSFCWR